MKVIFLDIDGVLNTQETFIKWKEKYKKTGIYDLEIDEYRIKYLKDIIDRTKAKIVLSSSWRYFFKKENNLIIPKNSEGVELCEMLKKYDIEIYDITKKNEYLTREEQIKAWINENNADSFIVIDDEKLDIENQIKTNFYLENNGGLIGLCEEHIDQAVNLLNKKDKVLKKCK